MPCLLAIVALAFPRFVLLLVFLSSDYLGRAYATTIWPVLGFLFAPLTTLAYAAAINTHGKVDGVWLVLVVVAVLFDLGLFGYGARRGRRKD